MRRDRISTALQQGRQIDGHQVPPGELAGCGLRPPLRRPERFRPQAERPIPPAPRRREGMAVVWLLLAGVFGTGLVIGALIIMIGG